MPPLKILQICLDSFNYFHYSWNYSSHH